MNGNQVGNGIIDGGVLYEISEEPMLTQSGQDCGLDETNLYFFYGEKMSEKITLSPGQDQDIEWIGYKGMAFKQKCDEENKPEKVHI